MAGSPQARTPPKALAPEHRDPYHKPRRTVSVIRHGIDWLRRLLLKGRLWNRVWLLPEPWPEPKPNLEIRTMPRPENPVHTPVSPPPPDFSDNRRQQPVPLSALAGHGAAGPAAEERLLPGHDGLIEIGSLHQLYALRWDLDGDRTGGEPVALPHFSRLPDFSRLPGAEAVIDGSTAVMGAILDPSATRSVRMTLL